MRLWNAVDGELLRRRTTTKSTVTDMAFSPDGTRLAVSLLDGTVHILAVDTEDDTVVEAHEHGPCGVAFSPNGDWIATVSVRGTLGTYDAQFGAPIRQYSAPGSTARRVSVSPDCRWLAAGGIAYPVDGSTTEVHYLDNVTDLRDVAFSPDGTLLIWAVGQETVVFSRKTRKQILKLCGHNGAITSLAFSPDGQRIVSSCNDGTFKIWDAKTGAELITFSEHTRAVNGVEFSSDGTCIISCSSDGTVNVYRTEFRGTEKPYTLYGTGPYPLPGDRGSSVHYSADSHHVVIAQHGGAAKWDLTNPHCLAAVDISIPECESFCFNGDATRAACHVAPNALRVWDVESGDVFLQSVPSNSEQQLGRFRISPNGDKIAALYYNRVTGGQLRYMLTIADVTNGKNTILCNSTGKTRPLFEFSQDGGRIAFWAGPSEPIRLVETDSGKELAREGNGRNEVLTMLFSPDGKELLIADSSRRSLLTTRTNGKTLIVAGTVRDRHANYGAAFNSDGTVIAANTDSGFQIFQTDSFPTAITLPESFARSRRTKQVNRIFAFTPDGKRLATIRWLYGLDVWNATTGELIGHRPLDNEPGAFAIRPENSAKFSPDGHWFVSPRWAIRCTPGSEHRAPPQEAIDENVTAQPNVPP